MGADRTEDRVIGRVMARIVVIVPCYEGWDGGREAGGPTDQN